MLQRVMAATKWATLAPLCHHYLKQGSICQISVHPLAVHLLLICCHHKCSTINLLVHRARQKVDPEEFC